MEWQSAGLLLLVLLIVFLLSGFWVSFSLGAAGLVILYIADPAAIAGVGIVVWNTMDSFVLTSVPLFVFMGSIILNSGVSTRFYKGLSVWFDFIPGSLTLTNILACGIFAAISGSSVATAAAIGSVAIPEMEQRKYDRSLTYGSLAAGGTLGILIPPSIPLIIYGAMVSESVGRLFIAAIIPGIMLMCIFLIYVLIRTSLNPSLVPRSRTSTSWAERFWGLLDVLPIFALMFLVLGGIYLGLMTPTEAAAIGAAGALVISLIGGNLNIDVIRKSLSETVKITGMVMFILIGTQLLSYAMLAAGIPRAIVNIVAASQASPLVIFILVVVMYLILGCLMDALAMILLTLPVVYPVMTAVGYDSVWFGVVLVILVEIAQITPPVGINLFVIQGLSKRPLNEVIIGAFPYVFLMLLMLVILTYYPGLALWLPSKMM
jgi:C4-dicarboxylate transporter, DctM subunit